MSGYVTTNPVREHGTDTDGTRTASVAKLGRHTHYISRDDRMPAFAGLAKSTGGFYAENQDGMTLGRALRAARMDFRVESQDKIEVTEMTPEGLTTTTYPYRGTRALWEGREHEPVGLGMVKNRYQIVQPAQAGELGQAIMDESGANVVAAGIYGKPVGAQTYMAFKLPGGMTIGGEDTYDLYLTILNSFNGASGLTGLMAPIRLACTNMTTVTFGRRTANRFVIRHSGNTENKLVHARNALGIATEWTSRWKIEAERLLATPITDAELDAFLEKAMPTPATVKTDAGERNWTDKRFAVKHVITRSETCEFGRGTAYAALQGVHEWADWMTETRAAGTAGDVARYTRIINGTAFERVKIRAGELLGV